MQDTYNFVGVEESDSQSKSCVSSFSPHYRQWHGTACQASWGKLPSTPWTWHVAGAFQSLEGVSVKDSGPLTPAKLKLISIFASLAFIFILRPPYQGALAKALFSTLTHCFSTASPSPSPSSDSPGPLKDKHLCSAALSSEISPTCAACHLTLSP